MLEAGWVQIHRVPDVARTEDAIKVVAELAGDVLVVDELSLIREGLVRVKIRARNIAKIRGDVQVFIEGEGYPFRFIPELPKKRTTFEKGEASKKKDEDQSEEEEKDENDKLTEWEKAHKEYEAKMKNLQKPEESVGDQRKSSTRSDNIAKEVLEGVRCAEIWPWKLQPWQIS